MSRSLRTAVCFPLTPALSFGKRGNRLQFCEQLRCWIREKCLKQYRDVQSLFPLPGGEGQGEGKRVLQSKSRHRIKL